MIHSHSHTTHHQGLSSPPP